PAYCCLSLHDALPISLLMLTARGRPEDVLKGFESGADDYLPKPFNLSILIARIESLLRRKNWSRAAKLHAPDQQRPNSDSPDILDRKSTRLNSSHRTI